LVSEPYYLNALNELGSVAIFPTSVLTYKKELTLIFLAMLVPVSLAQPSKFGKCDLEFSGEPSDLL
jgi:hypothetical protein